jgi:purine-nucleoside phosphorylase
LGILEKLEDVRREIDDQVIEKPEIGLILGSGLGDIVDTMEVTLELDYNDIPYFPAPTVEGHKGKIVFGRLEGKRIVALQGRFHLYEGYTPLEVVFPVYVMHMLGVKVLCVTNACGGLNPIFHAGDLMLMTDHLNLTETSPLLGPNVDELGPRFLDMSQAYCPLLQKLTREVAKKKNLSLQEGVYAGVIGPTYSTMGEYKLLRLLGADVVGMSTVSEVIVANFLGLKTLGISCITDCAYGDELEPLTHQQVIEIANQTKPKFIDLLKGVIGQIEVYQYC